LQALRGFADLQAGEPVLNRSRAGAVGVRTTKGGSMPKAAAIVFADTGSPKGLGRVMNALTTAQEFKDAGDDVLVVFDGAGTKWIAELSRENHKYHQLFEDVRDVVGGACSYCAEAFGVKEAVQDGGIELLEDYKGHPSVRTLVNDGYEIVTF
jgi:hypothetical protein